ncbi:MAG TPA: sugar phosphate isomerase/epimerase family protein [Bryobacteraceae bacterium]|nr:sugar phosphate isomerase/epimerase family protein [Bryobacteraceae bacterium]
MRTRRHFLGTCGIAAAGAGAAAPAPPEDRADAFRYCLNTATLQGYKLGITEIVAAAAKAGYQAIEPWLSQLTAYTRQGGSAADLRKRIADAGLTVESAIAFAPWMVDDPDKRAAALEQARREMDLVAQIGGKRIAAPPAGANNGPPIALDVIVERYRALLKVGDQSGVIPELEFWGPSVNLSRLSQAVYVALETGHPKACVLADVFHLYKGGSGFQGLRLLSGGILQVLHLNDYPGSPPRNTITDADRVYPGDGVAPMTEILGNLRRVNPGAVLSLEVFNPAYWKGNALDTAMTGLGKMKKAVREAIAAG